MEGRNLTGSSAYTRHSTAQPLIPMSSCVRLRGRPEHTNRVHIRVKKKQSIASKCTHTEAHQRSIVLGIYIYPLLYNDTGLPVHTAGNVDHLPDDVDSCN